MDLRWMDASPTPEEKTVIDEFITDDTYIDPDINNVINSSSVTTSQKRHLLLPSLQSVQGQIGWISKGALNYICQKLHIPPAEAYGVASFYALLSLEPRPPRIAHICDDIACKLAGADQLCFDLTAELNSGSVIRSPCLGQCEHAPAAFFQIAGDEDYCLAPANTKSIRDCLAGSSVKVRKPSSTPQTADRTGETLTLLDRFTITNPTNLDDYLEYGGYQALQKAISLGPAKVIQEVKNSGIRGRGGAAFPMGIKWEAVAKEPNRPHYIVCNADESEPGTFKDRVLMEEDPFAIVEAMTIAGFATDSQKGFLYIRGEYPLATKRLQDAITTAIQRGYLGKNIMDTDVSFDIDIRKGAGAYICGEETALFNSIEGFRGEPRNKPPFPTQKGLFGMPTVVNNVETLANVLSIVNNGGSSFAANGTNDSSGPKLFCLSGHVKYPGLYEVPFGTTLRSLLDRAGAAPNIQAVLLGGAAGSFLGPDELEIPLTFEGTRQVGASLGSGVVMVFDDSVDLATTLLRIAEFFRDESCGQCVPCRIGTVRVEEALHRIVNSESRQTDHLIIADLAVAMRDASICGLGHTAVNAIESALAREMITPHNDKT